MAEYAYTFCSWKQVNQLWKPSLGMVSVFLSSRNLLAGIMVALSISSFNSTSKLTTCSTPDLCKHPSFTGTKWLKFRAECPSCLYTHRWVRDIDTSSSGQALRLGEQQVSQNQLQQELERVLPFPAPGPKLPYSSRKLTSFQCILGNQLPRSCWQKIHFCRPHHHLWPDQLVRLSTQNLNWEWR